MVKLREKKGYLPTYLVLLLAVYLIGRTYFLYFVLLNNLHPLTCCNFQVTFTDLGHSWDSMQLFKTNYK